MSIASEIAFRIVGLFYVASGVLVARTLAMSAVTDATWSAIVGKASHPAERAREIWLAAGSVCVAAAGLALMLMLDVAAPLFVLATLQQLVYLYVVAPRFFDPHDAPEPTGRARTRNAAFVHLAVTVVVVAAAMNGALRPWRAEPVWLLGAAAAAVGFGALWTLRAMRVPEGGGEAE
ncbi:MAG: hypothetical protein LWW93_17150 [Hyphomicrobiales bacterium]|nr:hypothetical protein [Hyphomicrobiales bacterium]